MRTILLDGRGEAGEWRDAARTLLLAGVEPRGVDWRLKTTDMPGLFEPAQAAVDPPPAASATAPTVPRAFLTLAESVLCHSDPGRFDLLYRLLWRLQKNRELLSVKADADVAAAFAMEKSVRRDSHKMKAFVRFKELPEGEGARRRFVAWFEPDHHIVPRTAPFFQRRFNDMDWLILTPKGSAGWDGKTLQVSGEPAEKPALLDETDELWRTYFTNIFNPARLKVKAMQAEMPKKYWKNLPEAELIPGLIASAEHRVRGMIEQAASQPPVRHERRRPVEPQPALPAPGEEGGSLPALAEEAKACTRCPLYSHATQTVFGEGPQDASLFFIGEQPGDREDIAGRPFVGPAGQIFDRAAAAAGIDRSRAYVTNAVKRFKYEPRGKRRIHKRPDSGEIAHCRWWLQKELETVRPKVIVALGATAVEGLLGDRTAYAKLKGQKIALNEETVLIVTIHPSYLLRLPDEVARAEEAEGFNAMMRLAAEAVAG
jgi:DNA polymerase